MNWSLVPDEPFEIIVEGRKLMVKPLTVGQKTSLAHKLQNLDFAQGGYDELMTELGKLIVSIEGFDEAPEIVLPKLSDAAMQQSIAKAIMGSAGLTEEQAGNSESSPPTA